MIVVCTGCSAKFRVADEKVGPRGAKLRCSRCQTVFSVRRDEAPQVAAPQPAAPAPPPWPPAPAPPAPVAPAPAPAQQYATDPFAVIAGLDRLPYHPPPPPPPAPAAPSPFEIDLAPPSSPSIDPFGSPSGRAPAVDPFAPASEPPPPPPEPPLEIDDSAGSAHLSLEEQTTPPPRKARTGNFGIAEASQLGMAGMAAGTEDPFASVAPLEPGEPQLGGSDGGFEGLSLPGLDGGLGAAEPLPPSSPVTSEQPLLHVDPFAAAAVRAAPLLVEDHAASPPEEREPGLVDTTGERRAAGAATLRSVAVNAVSLVALLLLTLAIWLGWHGGLSPKDALRPTTIVAALGQRPPQGPLVTSHVVSGFYDREHGAPLLFVRGTVASAAAAPLEGVKVAVELVRDGQVLARSEVPAGVVLGPETLFGVADASSLARAAAEAAEGATGRLQPGEEAPFLVAFVDQPGDLIGSSLRITATSGNGR